MDAAGAFCRLFSFIAAQLFGGSIRICLFSLFNFFSFLLVFCIIFDQLFPVFNRDAVIVRMDFRKRKKALFIAALFDKGCLKGWLDACHACQIYISL